MVKTNKRIIQNCRIEQSVALLHDNNKLFEIEIQKAIPL